MKRENIVLDNNRKGQRKFYGYVEFMGDYSLKIFFRPIGSTQRAKDVNEKLKEDFLQLVQKLGYSIRPGDYNIRDNATVTRRRNQLKKMEQ